MLPGRGNEEITMTAGTDRVAVAGETGATQVRALDVRAEESLSQAAYRRLRTEVVSGLLRPNERLIEADLSVRLGVSRTPVRDALMRLAADGLVDAGRRGWAVHEHTRDELVAIYETRAALEGYAAHLAALRATAQDLSAIEEALRLEERDDDIARSEAVASRNSEFHSVVFRTSRSPRLTKLIETNAEFYFNYRIASLYTSEELRRAFAGHYRLLEALRQRDPARAEAAVREHLREALDVMLAKGRW
jgi:DNA-binding GntR family transcriptional regulator